MPANFLLSLCTWLPIVGGIVVLACGGDQRKELVRRVALAFSVLMRTGIYPPEMRSVNLDFDWTYRRFGFGLAKGAAAAVGALNRAAAQAALGAAQRTGAWVYGLHGADGMLARTWSSGGMAFWVAVMLALYLLLGYL